METRVKDNSIIQIETACQICGTATWFKYELKKGYICERCRKSGLTSPYYYIVCNRCKRTFYSRVPFTRTCVKCVYTLWKPRRKKNAIYAADLLDGELFYWDGGDTILLKYNGKLHWHAGSQDWDEERICSTPFIYKKI